MSTTSSRSRSVSSKRQLHTALATMFAPSDACSVSCEMIPYRMNFCTAPSAMPVIRFDACGDSMMSAKGRRYDGAASLEASSLSFKVSCRSRSACSSGFSACSGISRRKRSLDAHRVLRRITVSTLWISPLTTLTPGAMAAAMPALRTVPDPCAARSASGEAPARARSGKPPNAAAAAAGGRGGWHVQDSADDGSSAPRLDTLARLLNPLGMELGYDLIRPFWFLWFLPIFDFF